MSMKSVIFAIMALLLPPASFGQDAFFNVYGFPAVSAANGVNALNAAVSGGYSQSWVAYGWMPLTSGTVTKIRAYTSGVTGILGASDLVCDVYSDANGVPGTSLGSSSTVTATPTGAAWVEWTGFSFAATAYTQYWIVLRNANAAPMTNYPSYRALSNFTPFGVAGGGNNANIKTSTNGGSTWTAVSTGTIPTYRVEYAGGIFMGYPFESSVAITSLSANERVYSARQAGAVFRTPSNFKVNVKGCGFVLAKNGSPTAAVSCQIYSDDGTALTSLGTSMTLAAGNIDVSVRWVGFYFPSAITLLPNTKYRVVLNEGANSDASSVYYGYGAIQMSNDGNSLGLLPIGGTLRGSWCASSCSVSANWNDSYNIPIFGLLLDRGGEFAPQSQGGGSGAHSSATAH
jgi:hypothetical protein